MKTLKNILKPTLCLSAVVLLFSLGGCDKKFVLSFPLTVAQHNLTLPAKGGSTHILVYSTGDWTIGFDRDIDWGSLDKRSGSGNNEFVFTFSPNYGISRRVTVRIVSGTLRDSVVLTQDGTMNSVTMSFTDTAVTVADTAATITVGFSTDLLFAGEYFNARVTYYDEDGNAADPVTLSARADEGETEDEEEKTPVVVEPWISNVVVSSTAVSFDVERNKTLLYRTADFTVYIENATGRVYEPEVPLTVTQIPAGMAR